MGRFIYHNYVVKKLGRFGNRFGPFWSGPFRIWAVLTIHQSDDAIHNRYVITKTPQERLL